jgi:hypothetical protein
LTIDDQLEALSRIYRHLEPGGLILLDLFNPDLSRMLEVNGQVTLEKIMVDPYSGNQICKLHSQWVDLSKQIIHITLVMDETDKAGHLRRSIFPYRLRFLFRAELELLLRHAGFEPEAIYGSFDLDEYEDESERLIVIARRGD